jgi:hypothetical protein
MSREAVLFVAELCAAINASEVDQAIWQWLAHNVC